MITQNSKINWRNLSVSAKLLIVSERFYMFDKLTNFPYSYFRRFLWYFWDFKDKCLPQNINIWSWKCFRNLIQKRVLCFKYSYTCIIIYNDVTSLTSKILKNPNFNFFRLKTTNFTQTRPLSLLPFGYQIWWHFWHKSTLVVSVVTIIIFKPFMHRLVEM